MENESQDIFERNCAIMSGRAYLSTRLEKNRFPIPNGWEQFKHEPDPESGFEAVSFSRGDLTKEGGQGAEIVIAYAGTGPGSMLISSDWLTNYNLAWGHCVDQLRQAAAYYMEMRKKYPNASITLTGQSLGGGLASLIGVSMYGL